MVSFKSLLLSKINNFRGGQLEKHVRQRRKLTNDPNILSIISSDKIKFVDAPKIQHKARSPKFSDEEINFTKDEIDKLLTKSIIKETCHEEKEFICPIFISHKSNGGIRLILNLKQLNKNIEYHHFKMDSINIILIILILKILISGYIDDFFIKDYTNEGCFNNVMSIAGFFDRLGFVVHPDKSVLIPHKKLVYKDL